MSYELFSKDAEFNNKPTLVFIDYEAWYYGLINEFEVEPDIMEWFEDVRDKGMIEDVFVFGDFSEMKEQAFKLRNITNNVFDCTKSKKEKEFTDFIMLDQIYQKLVKFPYVEQFILFSGDAHFQSVVAFLKNFNDKTVGVYAVKGTMSSLLKDVSSWYVEIEPEDRDREVYVRLIMDNLRWAEAQEGLLPTFSKTVEVIGKKNADIDKKVISHVLSELISQGYITQEERILPYGHPIRVLKLGRISPVYE